MAEKKEKKEKAEGTSRAPKRTRKPASKKTVKPETAVTEETVPEEVKPVEETETVMTQNEPSNETVPAEEPETEPVVDEQVVPAAEEAVEDEPEVPAAEEALEDEPEVPAAEEAIEDEPVPDDAITEDAVEKEVEEMFESPGITITGTQHHDSVEEAPSEEAKTVEEFISEREETEEPPKKESGLKKLSRELSRKISYWWNGQTMD